MSPAATVKPPDNTRLSPGQTHRYDLVRSHPRQSFPALVPATVLDRSGRAPFKTLDGCGFLRRSLNQKKHETGSEQLKIYSSVTADEIPDLTRLHLVTRLNGKEVQHTGIDDLIFDIPTLISYCSDWTPLVPGDVISTGTPEGVGFARKPPLWMKPDDVVEVEIDGGIGVLRNSIVAES